MSHLIFGLGHHCEVYADVGELTLRPPEDGVVLACDDPQAGGIGGVLAALAELGIWLPIIATSPDPRPRRVVDAIRVGALDYLRTPLQPERLTEALGRIAKEAQAYADARRKMVAARSRISTLSPREREVLDWLAEGRSNKMIARELEISPRTVEIHRANMMVKLGACHAAQAVRLKIEAHLEESGNRVALN
ncbi:response regulator transcription factor [Qipengyuania marisflavi]|nr:LuxR C-terminal-related transcriptional regulator [Qipengyuania marisflavi]